MLRPILALLCLPVLLSVQDTSTVDPNSFPRSTVALAEGLSFADNLTVRAPKSFLHDYPASAGGGLVHAVVEIPAGTCEKWEVEQDGLMHWDLKDSRPRHVKYLGYPCNYGMVPSTLLGRDLGGDGDPLDVLVLGPALPRGTVLPVQVIGLIRLIDGGDKDDKLIAVPQDSSLATATSLAQLDELFPGVTAILRTWFENYKGKDALQCQGFGEKDDADSLLAAAEASFTQANAAAAPAKRSEK